MTKEQINDLHHLLVNTIVDYINKNHIEDLQEVEFRADELQESSIYGKWCPATDSYLSCSGYNDGEHCLIGESC